MGDDQAEILERYSGQIPGSLWALGLPLLTMGIYIFAFLMWFTWSGWLSVSLLAITVSAATASLYLTLHVSRIFRS